MNTPELHTSREQLSQLEKSDHFVFHGSPTRHLTELKPSQPTSFDEPHGEESLVASNNPDVAIFIAVFKSLGRIGIGFNRSDSHPLGLVVSDSAWQAAHTEPARTGSVYVLDRADFALWSDHSEYKDDEWRTAKTLTPLSEYDVTVQDLMTPVQIIDDRTIVQFIQHHRSPSQ